MYITNITSNCFSDCDIQKDKENNYCTHSSIRPMIGQFLSGFVLFGGLSMNTKISNKVNILVDRISTAWNGGNSSNDKKFIENLKEMGLFIHYVDGDGNCLFRSIAHQLFQDESKWEICRRDIVNYIL